MSIERCLSLSYNYKYAGVEYGQECWVGNTLNVNGDGKAGTVKAGNLTDERCSFKCPGNATEFCGAGSVLSLYVLRAAGEV